MNAIFKSSKRCLYLLAVPIFMASCCAQQGTACYASKNSDGGELVGAKHRSSPKEYSEYMSSLQSNN